MRKKNCGGEERVVVKKKRCGRERRVAAAKKNTSQCEEKVLIIFDFFNLCLGFKHLVREKEKIDYFLKIVEPF